MRLFEGCAIRIRLPNGPFKPAVPVEAVRKWLRDRGYRGYDEMVKDFGHRDPYELFTEIKALWDSEYEFVPAQ